MKAFLAKDEALAGIGLALALVGILVMSLSGQRLWVAVGGALVVGAILLIAADSFRKLPAATVEDSPWRVEKESPAEANLAEAAQRGLALALQLAEGAYQQEAYDAAANLLSQALEMAQALGDRDVMAGILTNRGAALGGLGRYGEAIADLDQAMELFQAAADRRGRAAVLHNRGVMAATQKRWDEAMDDLGTALATFQELKLPEAEKTKEVLAMIEARELTAEVETFLRQNTIMMPAEPAMSRAAQR